MSENKLPLDEQYYMLEEALQTRSSIAENLEGLEHLNLDRNTNDPYLQAIYIKEGFFEPANLKRAFKMLKKLDDTNCAGYEPWKSMKVPIDAFVSRQMSLFYLGYQNVTERDLEASEDYLTDAIEYGHRIAMFERAEELFNNLTPNNLNNHNLQNAISLYEKSAKAGHTPSYDSLIECYRLIDNFPKLVEQYDIIINKYEIGSMLRDFRQDYINSIRLHPDNFEEFTFLFVNTLMKSKLSEIQYLLENIANQLTDQILDKLIGRDMSEIKLNNLLTIFKVNNLLYQKYMNKLLKAYSINNSIQSLLGLK